MSTNMSNRVQYEIVAIEVERLYARQFPPNSDKEIEKHIQYIVEYLHACGWEEDEYLERWMSEQDN